MHAVIEGKEKQTRSESYGADSLACKMPEADIYIVSCWHTLGLNSNYGMGAFPLTWSEISAFSSSQALRLSQWECEQLIMMSREYCSFINKSKERHYPSPWDHEDYNALEANRARVIKQAQAMRTATNNADTQPL